MFERVLAIGDIHGKYDKLINLWDKIKYDDSKDFLIFLGDYIDRGEKPVECIEFVMDKVKNNKNVHALMGNHEFMMQEFFHTCGVEPALKDKDMGFMDIWLDPQNGGHDTLDVLRELYPSDPDRVKKIVNFIDNLDVYNEDIDGFFFVHGGIDPKKDIHQQSVEDLVWIRWDCFDFYDNDKLTLVVGHTPVQSFDVKKNTPMEMENNIILLDTGSFLKNGKITCMNVLTKDIWQSL